MKNKLKITRRNSSAYKLKERNEKARLASEKYLASEQLKLEEIKRDLLVQQLNNEITGACMIGPNGRKSHRCG